MPIVSIKWGKERFEVALDPAKGVTALRAMLLQRTGVPIERQKLMNPKAWRGMLSDTGDLSALAEGHVITLMGSAEAPPTQPAINDDQEEEPHGTEQEHQLMIWREAPAEVLPQLELTPSAPCPALYPAPCRCLVDVLTV